MSKSVENYLRWVKNVTWLVWVCVGLSIALLLWGSNRGFDLTDEGFYMLSYTYPQLYWRSASGFHWLIAPLGSVFELSVVHLRLLRLGLLLGAHVFFAASFIHWVRRVLAPTAMQQGFLPLGFALLTASFVLSYSWLAQTPGYNDFAAICGLAIAGLLLITLAQARDGTGASANRAAAMLGAGLLLAPLSLVKCTAAFGLALVVVVVLLIALPRPGWAARLSLAGALLAGTLLGLLAIHGLCVDLAFYWRVLAELASQPASQPQIGRLILRYAQEFFEAAFFVLRHFWWSLLLVWIMPGVFYARTKRGSRVTAWLYMAGVLGGTVMLAEAHKWFKGGDRMKYSAQAYLLLIALAGVGWAGCRWRWQRRPQRDADTACGGLNQLISALGVVCHQAGGGWARKTVPVLFLFALPMIVSAGTAGHLFSPAVYLVAGWMAVLVVFCLMGVPYRLGRVFALSVGVFALVLMETQFVHGYASRPYRLPASLFKQTVPVLGLPHGSELRFDPRTAEFLGQLSRLLKDAQPRPLQPIVALYDMPGLVYLLGGVSPGSSWYSDEKSWRNISSLRQAASTSTAGAGRAAADSPSPFLLIAGELPEEDAKELRAGGIAYPENYRRLGSVACSYHSNHVSLWVPKAR